jgi:hypothetical protein
MMKMKLVEQGGGETQLHSQGSLSSSAGRRVAETS